MEKIVNINFLRNFVLLSLITTATGCTLLNQKDPDVIVTTEPMLTKSEEGEVEKVVSADSVNLDFNEEKGYTLGNNIIYFDYDKYSVEKDSDKQTVKKYANYLKNNNKATIRIEGHADERGSRAYNLALGEKRAQAVKNYLIGLGINPDRVSTISYGKERPAVVGSNDGAWAQNRRSVTLVN